MTASRRDRVKVAVLGGGCGALSAVWGLLQSDDADRYEITVYQLGWRLGGKGASGRNAAYGQRIEEHGLHIWGGAYENAFQMMRQVYGELDRRPDVPLSRWYDPDHPERSAFLPHDRITLAEFYDGRWQPWNLQLPANDELPGSGGEFLRAHDYVAELVEALIELFAGADFLWELEWVDAALDRAFVPGFARSAARSFRTALADSWPDRAFRAGAHALFDRLNAGGLHLALEAARALPRDPARHGREHRDAVLGPLQEFGRWLSRTFGDQLDTHAELRRLFVLFDLGIALVTGILRDELLQRGVDSIDEWDFADWLEHHGASGYTVESSLVRGWYAYWFANPKGQAGKRRLAASSALRTLLRMVFTYRGAFFWKMQAGMGDTIFGPLYEVLSRHENVRFAFFHELQELSIMRDGAPTDEVQSIRMARQVDLHPDRDAYAPLVDVKGLPCWPSEPRWEQLDPAQAQRLQAEEIDLESAWTPWQPVDEFTLEKGRDFDLVVLGIPPPALHAATDELRRFHKPWSEMLEHLGSVQTQAMQLWLDQDLAELGWEAPPTVGTVYASPFNTWANMDQLLAREDWARVGRDPRCVLYFCDTVSDATPIPPSDVHDFPRTQRLRCRDEAVAWLEANVGPLWPGATQHGTAELDWSLLTVVHSQLRGEDRFGDQYWRINIDPSQRYMLSLPRTARYRPRADGSGFRNLHLAGDWLATGLNSGCVEAAVMGGLQASQAISGWPRAIVGDGDPLLAMAQA